MSYRIVVAREAEKILNRLDRPTEHRIRTRFVQLAEDPLDPRLSAPLAERAGRWRVEPAVGLGESFRRSSSAEKFVEFP